MVRQGVPSVGLIHDVFEKLAGLQARQLGMEDVPLLIYPQDVPAQDPPEFVARKAAEQAGRLPAILIKGQPKAKRSAQAETPSAARAEAITVDDLDEFVSMAYARGWTDGLPVLPATEKKVREMIDYLGRDPLEVVGVVPPGEGIATVERIAINAVMAGCLPEYLPVVITALEALLDPAFELNRVQCTTAGPAPLTIISGPVVQKLGFNYGEGSFTGNGSRANSTVGRAVRLMLWNLGLGRPGQLSHATFGHPARYSYLIAERPPEDNNPWEQIHVTNGLNPEDSAVSVFPVGSHDQISSGIGAQTLENNLYVFEDAICNLGHFQSGLQRLLVINTKGANVFHQNGWTKAMFRDALLERCKRPVREIKRTGGHSATLKNHWTKLVDPNDDDAMVPAFAGPEQLQIMVSGGWAPPVSQCAILHSRHGEMVTRKIDWKWD